MGYLDSKGLQHAAWVTKNYAAQNWQMTKSKKTINFCPAPETEMEPIVDFMFTETPPSNGEPKSITNPSTITGISSIECSYGGKNLLYYPLDALSKTINGITFTYNNGSFTANGTSNKSPVMYRLAHSTENLSVYSYLPAGTYTLSGCPANGVWNTTSLILLDDNGLALLDNAGNTVIDYGSGRTFTIDEPRYVFCMMRLGYAANSEVSNIVYNPQLEIGNTITSFEAAHRTKVNISLGSTYYGGSLNFKTGELTVTHEGAILDGTLNPTYTALHDNILEVQYNNFSTHNLPFPTNSTFQLSSHFSYNASYTHTTEHFYISEYAKLFLWKEIESVAAYNTWLVEQNQNNTPVTIVWEVKTPYIIQLTPQQILSLPQEDKYTPRINTVYTDQKSVCVGYKRLDCIELRSDQTVHGEKTFADSPLVPNPDDLNSQQAAPISFVKDMLRAEVEAMSGGRNTIIRDQWNNPHVMVRIPKFLLKDIDSSWPNEPHPAFIVNGVQKSEIFIGKYLASQSSAGKVQTLPRQAPWTRISFDNALTVCRALGNGFCLNTNASWAARVLWLYKTLGEEHEYLGNRNYGRDSTYYQLTGTMKNDTYIPGNTSISDAATLTGSGGEKWNDDESAYGIADLVGNVWEWVTGFRTVDGEIQLIPNNDALDSNCDLTSNSSQWKAILENNTLVNPNTSNTLKFDSAYVDKTSFVNVGIPTINTTKNNTISVAYNGVPFKDLSMTSGLTVPDMLKYLALFPITNTGQSFIWIRNDGEHIPFRGGDWWSGNYSGPFAIDTLRNRSFTAARGGFRTAYIA